MGAISISVVLPAVILLPLSASLGDSAVWSYERQGRLLAALFTGALSALALTGSIADRFSARPFAVGGNVLVSVGLAILAMAQTYGMAMVGALAMGWGAGTLDMVLSPIVAALYPARRAAALNRVHSTFSIGAVSVSLLAAVLFRFGFSWRWIAGLMAAFPLAVASAFLRVEVPALIADPALRTGLRVLIRRRDFGLLMGLMVCIGAAMAGIGQWLPSFTVQSAGLGAASGGIALSLYSASMGLTRWWAGGANDSHAVVRRMGTGAIWTAVLALVAAGTPWSGVSVVACVLIGVSTATIWPTVLAVASERFPHGGGSMFGFLSAAGNIGCLVAPWAVGLVADAWNLRAALGLVAIPALAILALLFALRGMDPVVGNRESGQGIRR